MPARRLEVGMRSLLASINQKAQNHLLILGLLIYISASAVATAASPPSVSVSASAVEAGRRSWGGGGTLALFLEPRFTASTGRAACSLRAFMRRMNRSTWPAVSTIRCSPVKNGWHLLHRSVFKT